MHYIRGTDVAKMVSHHMHPFNCIRPKMMYGSVLEHFENIQHVKGNKTCVLGLNALYRGTEVPKMVSHQMHPFYCIRPKMMFGSVLEHFENIRHIKRCKICVLGVNALYRGTEVAKMVSHEMHPFYSIGTTMMYGSVLEHFENIQHVKGCKTCVSGLNALFRGTEVAKMVWHQMHPFYCIRPKIMFGCVLEHFGNIRHVKRCRTCVSGLKALCRDTEVAKMVSHQIHPFCCI